MSLDLATIHDLPQLEKYLTDARFSAPMKRGESPFLDFLQDRVMIFDGGMGTQIFTFELTLKDFWEKENCVDLLVLSRPDVIEEIHARYFAAGRTAWRPTRSGRTRWCFPSSALRKKRMR